MHGPSDFIWLERWTILFRCMCTMFRFNTTIWGFGLVMMYGNMKGQNDIHMWYGNILKYLLYIFMSTAMSAFIFAVHRNPTSKNISKSYLIDTPWFETTRSPRTLQLTCSLRPTARVVKYSPIRKSPLAPPGHSDSVAGVHTLLFELIKNRLACI